MKRLYPLLLCLLALSFLCGCGDYSDSQVAAIEESAYDRGFSDGYDEGFSYGYNSGYEDGYSDGGGQ